jgi:hypothetical protein
MKVLDAEGLVEGCCSCYKLMEREMDRIYEVSWRELARREDQKITTDDTDKISVIRG